MKRYIAIILTILTLFSATGCTLFEPELPQEILDYKVPHPTAYPDYTFDTDSPTTDQLRETAVRAMRDILAIQWCTEREITYRKTGPVNQKQFRYEPLKTFCGLHYSNASTGLFQFLEYYDFKSGYLRFPGDSRDLRNALGSSCADTILWAWSTVATSFTGGYYTVFMVPQFGYIPVNNYKIPNTIPNYNRHNTKKIIAENTRNKMYEAYAKMLPADALVNSVGNHAIMAIEPAVVKYYPDGRVNPYESYVVYQDQRAGGTTFYENVVDGQLMYFTGSLRDQKNFNELANMNYIPLTLAEFLGTKAYEKAAVTVSNDNPKNLNEVKDVVVTSNYPLALINVYAVSPLGSETLLKNVIFGGYHEGGVPRSYKLGNIKELSHFNRWKYKGHTLKFEVVVSTGERFVPLEFKK